MFTKINIANTRVHMKSLGIKIVHCKEFVMTSDTINEKPFIFHTM